MKKILHVLFLIFSTGYLSLFTSKAEANQTWCSIQYLDTSTSEMKSIAIGLGEVNYSDELCNDSSISLSIVNNDSKKFISASGQSIATGSNPISYYTQNTWSRPLTEAEKDLYWCLLTNYQDFNLIEKGGDFLISFMPSTPEQFRIPTIIENQLGQGTLAAKLILELYSACWQLLAILALIKFYKLIPFKST